MNSEFKSVISFLDSFCSHFSALDSNFNLLMKEEHILKDNILVKSGFLIHHYSINQKNVSASFLLDLKNNLQKLVSNEVHLKSELKSHVGAMKNVETFYFTYKKKHLHSKRFKSYFNNSIKNAKHSIIRIDEILKLNSEVEKINFHLDIYVKKFVSLEKMLNQIVKFIRLAINFVTSIKNFKQGSSYTIARVYGRAMNKFEFKKTVSSSALSSGKDPTPVFDCPKSTYQKIISMTPDQRKTFFKAIGVEGGKHVVMFKTTVKPVNADNPIPQSNGLKEYKFTKGLAIDILEAA